MPETTKIFSLCRRVCRSAIAQTVAIITTCFASFVTPSQAETFQIADIIAALSVPPLIHPTAQHIARTFVDYGLPRMISSDATLAKQLGLPDFQGSRDALDSPLPIVVLYPRDIREFVKAKSNPFQAINKDVNWIRRSDGKLAPARLLFPIKLTTMVDHEERVSWSSVTVGKTPFSPWHITQVGGPKLMHAIKLYAPNAINFIVWIPGINRHYLCHLEMGERPVAPHIKMTVLFDDALVGVSAGEDFDPETSEIVDKLKRLDEGLQYKARLQRSNVQQKRALKKTAP